jgi:hypothetical protein
MAGTGPDAGVFGPVLSEVKPSSKKAKILALDYPYTIRFST